MESNTVMAPVYEGYAGNGNRKGKEAKESPKRQKEKDPKYVHEDILTEALLNQFYILDDEREREDRRRFLYTPVPSSPFRMLPTRQGLESRMPYSMPSRMTSGAANYNIGAAPMARGYSPMATTGGMQAPMMQGSTQLNIQYTSADGTTYQMGVVTSPENRGKALGNLLTGLYGLMMAEGKNAYGGKGQMPGYSGVVGRPGAYGAGKAGAYSAGRGSYGAGKGGGRGGSSSGK